MYQPLNLPTNPTPDLVPSTQDPTITALVVRLLRAILTILGAVGITWGATLNDPTLTVVAGGILDVAMIGWSIYEAFSNAKHTHAVAEASATEGKPVQPTASVVR